MFRPDLKPAAAGNLNLCDLTSAGQQKRDDFKCTLRHHRENAHRGRGSSSITVRNPAFFLCPTPSGRKTGDFKAIFVDNLSEVFLAHHWRGAQVEVKPQIY